MKSCAKICLKNHSQDKMIKEKRCPRTSWNYIKYKFTQSTFGSGEQNFPCTTAMIWTENCNCYEFLIKIKMAAVQVWWLLSIN